MKICGFDVETYEKRADGNYYPILDATGKHFLMGCLTDDKMNSQIFRTREEAWNRIIEMGRKEMELRRVLYVYMHNAKYDFYNIVNWEDRNLTLINEKPPFIANYSYTNKDGEKQTGIRFLDSMSLFKMSLKDAGKYINTEKLKMPEMILGENLELELMRLTPYVTRDTEIVVKLILQMKEELKQEGIGVKRIISRSQIAIGWLMNELRKLNEDGRKGLFYKDTEIMIKPKYPLEVHEAYRGGRCQAWKTGETNNVTAIDINSLYPFSLAKMRFPNLATERKVPEPLRIYNEDKLLEKIGISRAMVFNKNDEYGILLVRTNKRNVILRKGQYGIGTWTNQELKEAKVNGHKILGIEWSILFEERENPFTQVINNIYTKRKQEKIPFKKEFYKMVMNHGIGKFAQHKMQRELLVDTIEKADAYIQKNYEILRGIDGSTDVIYQKETEGKPKRYYCPIIPTLVNGEARVLMSKEFRRIPISELVYTDTDDIYFTGNHEKKFNIGWELGQFKVKYDFDTQNCIRNETMIVYGLKTKMFGNTISVSGIRRKDADNTTFKKGWLKGIKMKGIKGHQKEIGKFVMETRDLKKQLQEHLEEENEINKLPLLVDNYLTKVTFFVPLISEYIKSKPKSL